MQPLSADLLAGADAAASYVGISRRAIYHMVEAGHLPVIRKGRAMFFRRSELEKAFSSAAIA